MADLLKLFVQINNDIHINVYLRNEFLDLESEKK